MQNAKDTFYVALRNCLAVLNPARVVRVRGSVRPAIVNIENELDQGVVTLMDAFLLRWTSTTTDRTEPLALRSATCSIAFSTGGTPELSGMDRGRNLDALVDELRALLRPGMSPKQDFTGEVPVAMETNIFWSEPSFGDVSERDGALTQTATVQVFALEEVGDL